MGWGSVTGEVAAAMRDLPLMVTLIGAGLYLTIRLQLMSAKYDDPKEECDVSHFQGSWTGARVSRSATAFSGRGDRSKPIGVLLMFIA